jgi:hypothetical protein
MPMGSRPIRCSLSVIGDRGMPYEKTSELPEHAQEIYQAAFNNA